jgi:hypothetical protein
MYTITQLNCASRGRPGGGPLDKTPPVIIETFPRADSTGLTELAKLEIYFSERMNEGSVQSSIFISPPIKYEMDWSGGDELTLFFQDTVASNQTYVITVGSGAMDMQKNRLSDSYQFAFSTGDSLDRGEIYGRVFEISDKDVFYIYAYKIIDPDSLNPAQVTADFLSQPGFDGSYWLKYLPDGAYRVFVIEDQNKNLLLDAAYERIGIPMMDASVNSSSGPAGPINFRVTRIDTTVPEISGSRAYDNRTVSLRISEAVKHIQKSQISIIDTLNADTLQIINLARSIEEEKNFFIYTSIHDSAKGYRIFVNHLEDTTENVQPEVQITDFAGGYIQDTTHFELQQIEPLDSLSGLSLSASIGLQFSLPIDTGKIKHGFKFWGQDSIEIRGDWIWNELKYGLFQLPGGFKPGQQYSFTIESNHIQSIWGDTLIDSLYSRI